MALVGHTQHCEAIRRNAKQCEEMLFVFRVDFGFQDEVCRARLAQRIHEI